MKKDVNIEELKADTAKIFNHGFGCSETMVYSIGKHFDLDMPDEAIAMASGFLWGIGSGCACGALAGGTMCLGYLFGRTTPDDQKVYHCLDLAKEFHDTFKETCGSPCCRVLVKGFEPYSPERKAHCTKIVVAAVEKLAEIIIRETK